MSFENLYFYSTIKISKSQLNIIQKMLINSNIKEMNIQMMIEPQEIENQNPEFPGVLREIILQFFASIPKF